MDIAVLLHGSWNPSIDLVWDDCGIVHPSTTSTSQNIGGFILPYLRGIYTPMPRQDVKQKYVAFLKVIF